MFCWNTDYDSRDKKAVRSSFPRSIAGQHMEAGKIKLSQKVANDLRLQQPSRRPWASLQDDLSSDGPQATERNLGSTGLQVAHYRDLDTDEIRIGPLSQHLIVLFTKPPAEMTIRCGEVKRDSPPLVGSIALVPAGLVADVSWQGKKDNLHVYLEPDLVEQIAARCFEQDLPNTAIPPLDAVIVPEIRSAMLGLYAELLPRAAGGPLVIESLANILVVHLIRHVFGLRREPTRARAVLPRRKLALIIDYIMANLDSRPTLERMAELVHLSSDHFARQFKAATGLAPYQFVIARRVERAQQLLCGRKDVSLAEVALSAGFSDQSQLCFHFKRIVGVTPGQFRTSGIA